MTDRLRLVYVFVQLAAIGLGMLGGLELVAWVGE
jgi:hypothetical protein